MVRPGWHRDFRVVDSISLEVLSAIVQRILGWPDSPPYEFSVKGEQRADFHFDYSLMKEFLADDHLSCAISLRDLGLETGDEFLYTYDFSSDHEFLLTVLETIPAESRHDHPLLITCVGGQLVLSEDGPPRRNETPESVDPPQRIDVVKSTKHAYRVRLISPLDWKTLRQWRKSRDKREWEMAVAITDGQFYGVDYLAEKIERPATAVQRWIRSFNAHGLAGLLPRERDRTSVRERTERKTRRILEILHHPPSAFGVTRSNWSQESIAEVYRETYGENICKATVSRLIREAGYGWRKAKKVLTSSDSEFRDKVERLLRVLQSLQPQELLFFVDELGPLQVKKYGGRSYVKKGKRATVPQKQVSKGSITLCGALSATTNQMTWFYSRSKDTASMIDLLEILFNQHFDKSRIYVTWDAASWHGSDALVRWLDQFNSETRAEGTGPVIEFIPLPSNSQFLNVIEAVFSAMKGAVIQGSDYRSENQMKQAISRHFVERNEYFAANPKRAGKKIWEIDFFQDQEAIKSGNYRDW